MPCLELETEPATAAYARPNYAQRFQCITSACEDTCCNGWTIPIDRRTVDAYREHPVLKPFAALLVLNNENPSSGDFARMPLTHSGTCAFLNPEKLCGIHSHFGETALSVACNSYPRETSHHLGTPETALNLSCPEAARITLLDPRLLDAWRPSGRVRAKANARQAGFDPILAVRECMLLLLTDRRHSIPHRLSLMAELAESLPNAAWAHANPVRVAELIDRAHESAARSSFHPVVWHDLQFTHEVLAERLAEPPVPQRFLECVAEYRQGIVSLAEDPSAERFLKGFMAMHPYLMENYIANHIFKYSYPFGRNPEDSPAEANLYLSALTTLIQTMLLGVAAHHGEAFNMDHAIKLIQSLSRAIEHRQLSRRQIVDRMMGLHLHGASPSARLATCLVPF
jgi:lysine-N-methylase